MRISFLYCLLAISLTSFWQCTEAPKTNTEIVTAVANPSPPYTVQLEEFVNPNIPGLHSYIHAVNKDKIIMIGGRTNGMHPDYNFDLTFSNQTIYVVDTKNWADPATWSVSSMLYTNITGVNNTQFRSNNAQYFQEGNTLYIVGGLEYANVPTKLKSRTGPVLLELVKTKNTQDGKPATGPKTLPLMTAINMDTLVAAVMNNQKVLPPNVRQVRDSMLAITGGELQTIDNTVYLVFGWNFGLGDDYSHQIRSFTYTDDGKSITLGKISVCPTCWDNQSPASDSGNYRRRDGTLSLFTDPADGSQAMMYYAGVFKNGSTNFTTPVFIHPGRAQELASSTLYWNVYTCQAIPAYSPSRKASYASLLGGMTWNSFTGGNITQPTLLSAANTKPINTGSPFDNIPLTNRFTTVMMDQSGNFSQYLLPDSFPPIKTTLILPAPDTLPPGSTTYNGSEAEMHWTLGEDLAPNGVVNIDAFFKANPAGGSVAYLHGGIEAAKPNVFGGTNTLFSVASKRLFKVKIVPVK